MLTLVALAALSQAQPAYEFSSVETPGTKLIYSTSMTMSVSFDSSEIEDELKNAGEEAAEILAGLMQMFGGDSSMTVSQTMVIQHHKKEGGATISTASMYLEGYKGTGLFEMAGDDVVEGFKSDTETVRSKRLPNGRYLKGGFPLFAGELAGLPVFPSYAVSPGDKWAAVIEADNQKQKVTHHFFGWELMGDKRVARFEISGLSSDLEIKLTAPVTVLIDPLNGRILRLLMIGSQTDGPTRIALNLRTDLVRVDEASR